MVSGRVVCGVTAAVVALVVMLAACQPVRPVDEVGLAIAGDAAAAVGASGDSPVDAETEASAGAETEASAGAETEPTPDAQAVIPAEATDNAAAGGSEVDGTGDGGTAVDAAMVEAGKALYRAQYCGICHALAAAETTGRFGPPHDGIGAFAESRLRDERYVGAALTAEEYLYESLTEPSAYIVEGFVGTSHAMPPYTHLPEADLRALVAYLLVQR